MPRNKNPANPMPQMRRSTSFSSTYQPPADHYRGEYNSERGKPRHKRTVAKEAFEKMGHNPMEVQISMVKMYQDMLNRKVGWDGETPITAKERESFCKEIAKINQDLMTYQTAKASVQSTIAEREEDEEIKDSKTIESEDRPLNPSELLETRRTMGDSRKSLEDKIS